MAQVVFHHLTGTKARTVDSFPLEEFTSVLVGRDAAAALRYDATRDDLVGRQHARIARDPQAPHRFVLSDLDSRNGTYVNGRRIVGTIAIEPGDVIQFGPGGPDVEFQIDPLPPQFARRRRRAAPAGLEATQLAAVLDGHAALTIETARAMRARSVAIAIMLVALLLGTLTLVTCRMASDVAALDTAAGYNDSR
jgi:serine protease Do